MPMPTAATALCPTARHRRISDTNAPDWHLLRPGQQLGATGQRDPRAIAGDGQSRISSSDLGMRQPEDAGLQPNGAPLTPEQEQG